MSQKNISQVQLGNHVEKSKGTVNSWISRDVIPSGDIVFKISKLLNTSVEFLITGHEYGSNSSPIRKAFQEFVDMSTDDELQKMWDFFELMRGKKS